MPTRSNTSQWQRKGNYGKFLACFMRRTFAADLVNTEDGLRRNHNLVLAVASTRDALLRQEDLDGDGLITVEDGGPKVQDSWLKMRCKILIALSFLVLLSKSIECER